MAGEKVEIRGLGDIVRDAKKSIAEVREHSAGLRDDTRALKKTLVDVREQVNNMHDDLKFEVGTLGNGGGENEPESSPGSSEKPADPPAVPEAPEQLKPFRVA